MFGLLGIRLHPAVRAVLGAALLVVGIAIHHTGMAAIGGVFLAWAAVGLIGPSRARGEDADVARRPGR